MKLYALLIGINYYDRNSEPQINHLDGCLNDIFNIQNFLQTNYSDMLLDNSQIVLLRNEEATRQNVIDGFRKHLSKAQEGDVALIYFSGHGSVNTTAPEFQQYTMDNQEQTWVLYDSRTKNGLDLADKEIALLLMEIGNNQPQIVVISDSCHSGSVTREVEDFMNLKVRMCKASNEARTLDSYLYGAYLTRANLRIPETKHILLSACDRSEKARETSTETGFFSSALLSVLEKTGGQLQYAELFVQVRATIQNYTKNQTPQVEPHGGFNPRIGFLGRKVEEGKFKRYRVWHSDNGNWKIDVGAAMGISSDLSAPIFIKVFDAVSEGNLIKKVQIGNLNVTQSSIIGQDILPNRDVVYWGEPVALPLSPIFVYAESTTQDLLKKTFDEALESGIYFHDNKAICRFEIKIESNNFLVYDTSNELMVQGVEGTDDNSKKYLMDILKNLARWLRTLELQNNKTKLNQKAIDFSLEISPFNYETQTFRDPSVTLEYDGQNGIPFKAILRNNSNTKLFFSLLYLTPSYGIVWFDSQGNNIINSGNREIILLENNFNLRGDTTDEIDTLKLIFSTNSIDSSILQLEGLKLGEIVKPVNLKGIDVFRSIGDSEPDWFTNSISIRIVRKKPASVGLNILDLGNGVEIQSHPNFSASLTTQSLMSNTRSLEKLTIRNAYFKKNDKFGIVNFAQKVVGGDQSIFELSEINNSESLKEHPLNIVLKPENIKEGITFPFIFDGENFLPWGKTTLDVTGEINCALNNIPDEVNNKTRGFGKSLRLVFLKFANNVGLAQSPNVLSWVDYSANATRKTEGLKEKIQSANKILLIIHGIIGDTKLMAPPFKEVVENKRFDLVLTYDYENLNTTIEETAKILLNTLKEVGFNENDEKELVIVAHSMGGLVSRYMIESTELGGDKLIDRLIMVGTPNAGSKFGDFVNYFNWMNMLLGFATNFFPSAILAIIGGILKTTEKSLFVTLEEMKPLSPFIENLSGLSKTKVPYYVVSGDVNNYLKTYSDQKNLVDKIEGQIGDWLYTNSPNDIAVSIESISSVEAIDKKRVDCHHLNYFEIEESMNAIKNSF